MFYHVFWFVPEFYLFLTDHHIFWLCIRSAVLIGKQRSPGDKCVSCVSSPCKSYATYMYCYAAWWQVMMECCVAQWHQIHVIFWCYWNCDYSSICTISMISVWMLAQFAGKWKIYRLNSTCSVIKDTTINGLSWKCQFVYTEGDSGLRNVSIHLLQPLQI